jgi:hypothetical protein
MTIVLGRRLHWKVGWLLTLEDAIDVGSRAPALVEEIRPVGDQAADSHKEAFEVDCGQFVPCRQRNDQIAMKLRQRAAGHDQATIIGARA